MSENTERNLGVIMGQRDSDYVGGTLPYEVVNPSGDWTPYLPPGEWQHPGLLETMACVSFSGLNVLETLHYFHTGERRNFSDRFTAKMSGTTPQGNWLWKVGDSIRKDGLIEEEFWPTEANPTWESYYATPPMEVVNKAKDFLIPWKVQYEFIDFTRESLLYHLKQSPIQVVFPSHAVMNFNTTESVYRYFDSYSPFVKERQADFSSALKYVLRRNDMMTAEDVKLQYVLAFYRQPTADELAFWTGKGLTMFLKTAIKDRASYLNSQVQ